MLATKWQAKLKLLKQYGCYLAMADIYDKKLIID